MLTDGSVSAGLRSATDIMLVCSGMRMLARIFNAVLNRFGQNQLVTLHRTESCGLWLIGFLMTKI